MDLKYRGTKFIPEIIQFGLIIADAEGNLVEKFSAYVKPTIFPQISGKTQEFLKITDASVRIWHYLFRVLWLH